MQHHPRLIFAYIGIVLAMLGCTNRKEHQNAADIVPTVIETSPAESSYLVIDNTTGEALGIMVNEVGDFYIINPGNEEIIPKEGHSLQPIPTE